MFIHVFNALRFMHGPSHSEEREFFFHPFSQRWTSKIWIPIHTTFCVWTVWPLSRSWPKQKYGLFCSLTRHQFGLEEALESRRRVSRSANRPQNQYFQNSIRYLSTTNQVNVLPLNSLFCFIYLLFTLLHPMKPLKLHFRDKLKQHVLLAISSENNMNGFFNERKGLLCTKNNVQYF